MWHVAQAKKGLAWGLAVFKMAKQAPSCYKNNSRSVNLKEEAVNQQVSYLNLQQGFEKSYDDFYFSICFKE